MTWTEKNPVHQRHFQKYSVRKKVVNAPVSSMFVLVVCRDASSSAPCSKASKEFAMCARSGAVNCSTPSIRVPQIKENMDHST